MGTAALSILAATSLAMVASAQVTMTATTMGPGVVVEGVTAVPAGTDVLAGFQYAGVDDCSTSWVSRATLTTAQTGQQLAASLIASAASDHWPCGPGSVHAAVEFVITATEPMYVDVTLQILAESVTVCGGVPMGSGSGSAQLLGFGPLTNEHCEVSIFDPPCRFTFDPMLVDSIGLTIQLIVDASVGSSGMCPFQSASFGARFEVAPSDCVQEYGSACEVDLSAMPNFASPGGFDITVSDPGAQAGVLMIGADQIALPLLGCTLYTTPIVAIPLPLDPSGAITFPSGLPSLPFSLQAATAENLVIHMSQGLRGCP